MEIIILILVYILSTYLSWLWMHKAHSKDGIFKHLEIVNTDYFLIFCPIVNTFCCFLWISDNPKYDRNNK